MPHLLLEKGASTKDKCHTKNVKMRYLEGVMMWVVSYSIDIQWITKTLKIGLFPSKDHLDAKSGKDLRLFCDKKLTKQIDVWN